MFLRKRYLVPSMEKVTAQRQVLHESVEVKKMLYFQDRLKYPTNTRQMIGYVVSWKDREGGGRRR